MYSHVYAGQVACARLVKSTIIVALAIILYGCGPQNIRKDFDPTAPESGGVIFGTATQNFDSPDSFVRFVYDSGSDIMIQSIDTMDQSLTAMTRKPDIYNVEDGRGRLFVFELKPGSHKIETYQIDAGNFILYPKAAPPQLDFDIKAGEILYIGNFHMDMTSGKNFLGFRIPTGGIPLIRDKRERDLQLLYQKYPQLKEKAITYNVLHDGPWIDEAFKTDELVIPKSDDAVPESAP